MAPASLPGASCVSDAHSGAGWGAALERSPRKAGASAGDARAGEDGPPRPDHWGGYLVRPRAIEFWQGREGRMHDRFVYSREGESWRVERLAP